MLNYSGISLKCFPFPVSAINWVTDTKSGKQYVRLKTKEAYQDPATKRCQNVGGMLPEPRNSEENDFVDKMAGNTLVSSSYYVFISCNCIHVTLENTLS